MTPVPPPDETPQPGRPTTFCLLDHEHGPTCGYGTGLSFHPEAIRQEALWRASYNAQRRATERLWHQRITTACIVLVTLLAALLLVRLIMEIPA